jgi:hypothetical protein
MRIQLQMGPNYNRMIASLGIAGKMVVKACSEGLARGVKLASSNVVENYLTGSALKRRTGNLARAVDGWMEDDLDGVVGVRDGSAVGKYAWLLGPDQKTITPKNGKFLTIPIGENLTAAGVPRYTSPRQVEGGFFINTNGRLLFGYKKGKKGKFRALFTLVTSVLVQGTDALYDGVDESLDDIAGEIETRIAANLN